jgi:hypothetical protein
VRYLPTGLREFPGETMHMHMIDASQPPQRLISLKRDAERGIARHHAVAVAMCVQHQRCGATQRLNSGKAAPVDARHHTRAALALHQFGVTTHRVEVVGDIEGDHYRAAAAFAIATHFRHDRAHAFGKRRMRWVRTYFVILYKIDACLAQLAHQCRGFLRTQTHVRFDDGADHGPIDYLCQRTRTLHAMTRTLKACAIRRWQTQRQ